MEKSRKKLKLISFADIVKTYMANVSNVKALIIAL